MKKRTLSLLLALVLCLGLLPTPASAAGATLTEIVSVETYQSFIGGGAYAIQGFHEGITWHGSRVAGYGAFDTNGNIIVAPGSYYDPQEFSDGVAWAFRDSVWCAIDTNGRELFTLNYSEVGELSNFHDGLARIYDRESKSYGYVDKTGKLVIPFEHNGHAGDFHDGLAVVYDSANAYYGYMDKTGKVVIPCQYSVASDFENGFASVKLGNRSTVIDTTGKDLLPQEYQPPIVIFAEAVSAMDPHKNGLSPSYAFFNRSGQMVSGDYDDMSFPSNGMAYVKKDGKYGFVNESGVLVIPCTLPRGGTFLDGYAAILTPTDTKNVTYNTIIDKTGKVTGTYEKQIFPVGNGCFKISNVDNGTRWGLIDYTGREIVSCKYKAIGDFSGGVAAVSNFDNKWGFVDTTGAEIVPCQYTAIRYTDEPGIFEAEKSDSSGRQTHILKSSGWTEPSVSSAASTSGTTAQTSSVTAAPTSSTVLVNGKQVAFDAYTIGGANYFKLRDLAYVLSGTAKQFSVGWDNNTKTIALTSGQSYTAVGGELASGASKSQTAKESAAKLVVDGREISLTAYDIGGNNYFKLRDIGEVFDFGIGWDNNTKTITIDTSTGYDPG